MSGSNEPFGELLALKIFLESGIILMRKLPVKSAK